MAAQTSTKHAQLPTDAVLRECVRIAFSKVFYAHFTVPITTAILGWQLWDSTSRPTLVVLLVVLNLVAAASIVQGMLFRRSWARKPDAKAWAKNFFVGSAVYGVAWGLTGACLFTPAATPAQFLLLLVVGGMAAGALTTHLTLPSSLHVFHALSLGPVVARLLFQADVTSVTFGLMMLVFAIVLTAIGHVASRAFARSVAMQIRHAAMVEQLAEARSELAAQNEALSSRVEQQVQVLRKREGQLHQAQKLESIGRLTGGIAHDFNNLLTSIVLYGRLAQQQVERSSQLHDDIGEMLRGADRGAELIAQLLAFSRGGTRRLEDVELSTIVRDMLKMLRPLIGQHIDIVVKLRPGVDRVRADRGQLERVIVNLVLNARDAMPEGGQVVIEARNAGDGDCAAQGTGTPAFVELLVTDSGVGMDDETQSKVFDPFFTTKERGKGTGLGLATVYGIVTQHGGSITVSSQLGKGTTFHIRLPSVVDTEVLFRKKAVETPEARPTARPPASETILVVDDDSAIRDVVCRILTDSGYRVLAMARGDQALAICAQHASIDLLLTDVVMPGMSGYELADRVRQKHTTIRILYMSGYTDVDTAERGAPQPGVNLIQKPFTPDTLLAGVRGAL